MSSCAYCYGPLSTTHPRARTCGAYCRRRLFMARNRETNVRLAADLRSGAPGAVERAATRLESLTKAFT